MTAIVVTRGGDRASQLITFNLIDNVETEIDTKGLGDVYCICKPQCSIVNARPTIREELECANSRVCSGRK